MILEQPGDSTRGVELVRGMNCLQLRRTMDSMSVDAWCKPVRACWVRIQVIDASTVAIILP